MAWPDLSASPPPDRTLASVAIGQAATVLGLRVPAEATHWARWLEEIGFLPGEQVMLMARAQPGGDPMVVRVGSSTFALRRAEAACVLLAGGTS